MNFFLFFKEVVNESNHHFSKESNGLNKKDNE